MAPPPSAMNPFHQPKSRRRENKPARRNINFFRLFVDGGENIRKGNGEGEAEGRSKLLSD